MDLFNDAGGLFFFGGTLSPKVTVIISLFLFIVILGFELRTLHLVGRHSTAYTMLLARVSHF
jgi:hypothetical protein